MAESIHNWFEASDPNLFPTTEGESQPSSPSASRSPSDQATSDKWVIGPSRLSVSTPREEDHKRRGEVDVAHKARSEAKDAPATCTVVPS